MTTTRTRCLLAGVALAALGTTACSPDAHGLARPDNASSQPATTQPDTRPAEDPTEDPAAPPVKEPLDATRFLTRPCIVLGKSQLGALGVSRPGIPTTTGGVAEYAGPYCSWHADPQIDSTIGVGFIHGNENGLSDMYRGRDKFEDFRPTEVDGYPAVFANSPDLRSKGSCDMAVGISDTFLIRASEQGRLDAQGACDRAMQVAQSALATIRGAK